MAWKWLRSSEVSRIGLGELEGVFKVITEFSEVTDMAAGSVSGV